MGIDIKEYLTPPVLLILFLLVVSLMIVFPVLNMIILGAILAYGVRPVARKIQSKLKFPSISILLAMVVILIPLILLIAYIFIASEKIQKSVVALVGASLTMLLGLIPLTLNLENNVKGVFEYIDFEVKFYSIYLSI